MTNAMATKEYIRPMPATWWLHNYHLTLFMIRELTSLFVAGYAVFLMVLLYRFNQGTQPFHDLAETLRTPGSIVLHLLALVFILYHSVTWLNLIPQVMVVWRGEEKVSPALIAGAHYGLWLVLSVLIVWIAAG
jgi:fumarate reductase subunit C